jgi:acyl-coenzyme A thioesterase PaaI-like protein
VEAGRGLCAAVAQRKIDDDRRPGPSAHPRFKLVEVEPGQAVFEVLPGEQHYNPIGVVHGGLAMTLLDSAMGCSVQTQMPACIVLREG